jgi:hypothetical protein
MDMRDVSVRENQKGGLMRYLNIGLIALVLVIAGCIEYEEKVTLRHDGSGTMIVHYTISESMLNMGKEGDVPLTFDKEEIEKELESENVKIEKIESYTDEGKRHIVTELSFKDINKLPDKWVFKDRQMSFAQEGGFFTFRSIFTMGEKEEKEEQSKEMDELGGQFADALLAEYSFKFSVQMPAEIVEARPDGKIEGNTVMWEFPLSTFSKEKRIVMTAKSKVPAASPVIWIVLVILAIVIAVVVFFVLKRKPKAATA